MFACQRPREARCSRSVLRSWLHRLVGLWVEALVVRYPLAPLALVSAMLVLMSPLEVAMLVGGGWVLYRWYTKTLSCSLFDSD